MDIRIEPISEADFPRLLELFREFAEFERSPHKMTNTLERMMAEAEFLRGFVARAEGCRDDSGGGGPILGYATCFFTYHTWTGKSLYMDDLYVRPEYRGKGLGTKLIGSVMDFGRAGGCHKLRWQVSGWNAPAVGFYRSLGAEIDDVQRNCDLAL